MLLFSVPALFGEVPLMAGSDSIILRLSVLEIRRLRDCAEREMHAGHWGSSRMPLMRRHI